MEKKVLDDALKELSEFIKKTIADRVQQYGKNRKGKNTLVNSDLINNMKVTTSNDSVSLIIADYWMYVSTGWKFNDFKNEKRGLFDALVNWALKKVTSDNEEAYRLASALYTKMIKDNPHRTIPARPFLKFNADDDDDDYKGEKGGNLTLMVPELQTYIDKWFGELFDKITKELDKYFNAA